MCEKQTKVSVACLFALASISCLKTEQSSNSKLDEFPKNLKTDQNQFVKMKMNAAHDKDLSVTASYEALIEEAKQVIQKSKDVCNGQNGHRKRNLLLSAPQKNPLDETKESILLSDDSSADKAYLSEIFKVKESVPNLNNVTNVARWIRFAKGNETLDLLLAPSSRRFHCVQDDRVYITMRSDNKFKPGFYGEEHYRAGSFDSVFSGLVLKDTSGKGGDVQSIALGDSFLRIETQNWKIGDCAHVYVLFQKFGPKPTKLWPVFKV